MFKLPEKKIYEYKWTADFYDQESLGNYELIHSGD